MRYRRPKQLPLSLQRLSEVPQQKQWNLNRKVEPVEEYLAVDLSVFEKQNDPQRGYVRNIPNQQTQGYSREKRAPSW